MWAKAPVADVSAQTTADRRGFLGDGLRPVECTACGTCVLVKKSSEHHTSIQWQTSTDSCPEYAAQNKPSALLDTCSKLRASIESLVADGLLEVPDG
ncbi:hypothetical protein [Kibdelosporangium phytohabitans]|uniref:Ferredoxin n=1 Tax=Kibdelosporangium phytohabitans TaxID=860235 RepID=A0A0N7F4Y2_9PSEU|nr:hypothetical protein [Kibdelosporangium phytohabitans]ALG12703.1 hypothetical protein AOZ06_42850 [Kibdelosporangium phytohabitans]MBE1464369.1 hypothetical protein [Kibdelosporangium phytohabitans]